MAAHVHDMHLGEADGAAAAEAGNGDGAAVSPGAAGGAEAGREAAGGTGRGAATGGPQSYAQAAGQRQAGASGAGGGAAQPQPHLAFYLGGRLLTPGTTVFQAVQQQLAAGGGGDAASSSASGGGADLGHLLWGEVHTISYRSWGAALQLQQNEAAASTATPRAGGAGRRGAAAALEAGDADSAAAGRDDASASPLAELLEGGHLPADLCAPRDALDALAVLRLAERLNRLAPHLAAWQAGRRGKLLPAGLPPPGHLPRDAFLSAKLSPKLSQQLKDVLSICGGGRR
jgi:E3 ubiquitin-protein ligase TRIP12